MACMRSSVTVDLHGLHAFFSMRFNIGHCEAFTPCDSNVNNIGHWSTKQK